MKGIESNVPLIMFLMIAVFVMVVPNINILGFGRKITTEMVETRDIHTLNNALLGARYTYLPPALKFSLYQACYDTFKEAKRKKELPNEENFFQGLKEKTLDNLNQYTEEDFTFIVEQYSVDLPEYQKIKLENIDWNSMDVIALSDEKISITGKKENETITLWKNATLNETISTPCYGLFLESWTEKTVLPKDINPPASEELKKWPTEGSLEKETEFKDFQVLKTAAEDLGLDAGSNLEETKEKISEAVRQKLEDKIEPKEEREGFTIKRKLESVKTEIKTNCDQTTTIDQDNKKWVRKDCEFEYSSTPKYQVNVTHPQEHPVYTGKEVEFTPLVSKFEVEETVNWPKS